MGSDLRSVVGKAGMQNQTRYSLPPEDGGAT